MNDEALRALVHEWRDAQKAIDRMTPEQRQRTDKPLKRLVEAHNALVKWADENE